LLFLLRRALWSSSFWFVKRELRTDGCRSASFAPHIYRNEPLRISAFPRRSWKPVFFCPANLISSSAITPLLRPARSVCRVILLMFCFRLVRAIGRTVLIGLPLIVGPLMRPSGYAPFSAPGYWRHYWTDFFRRFLMAWARDDNQRRALRRWVMSSGSRQNRAGRCFGCEHAVRADGR